MLYERDGRRRVEWRDIVGATKITAGPDGSAWMLVEGGAGLVRLDARGGALQVGLPFEQATAVKVDRRSGQCWVAGKQDIAAFSPDGSLLRHWRDAPDVIDLAVDGDKEQVWLATGGAVWKFSFAGENLARLTGFSTPFLAEIGSGISQ